MKLNLKTLVLLVIFFLSFSSTIFAEDTNYNPFEFHGYLRSGTGINSKGGQQEAFGIKSIGHKYRLGNEAETYGELKFTQNWNSDKTTRTHVLLAYLTQNATNFDPAGDQFTIREAYGEMGHIFAFDPKANLWAGQRYYKREDVHINDFYYLDMSGYGGGLENITTSLGQFSFAYLNGAVNKIGTTTSSTELKNSNIGRPIKQNIDLRLEKNLPQLGQTTWWLEFSHIQAIEKEEKKYPSLNGYALGAIFKQQIGMGENKLAILFGRGSSSNFSTWGEEPSPSLRSKASTLILDNYTQEINSYISIQMAVMQRRIFYLERNNESEVWSSLGLRPLFHLSSPFSIGTEIGVDHIEQHGNDGVNLRGSLYKYTVAPQYAPESTFFSRPTIRAFVTYASWSPSLRGKVAGTPYAGSSDGMSYGVQVESWW